MNGPDHYRAAERSLELASKARHIEAYDKCIREAEVHASLAQVAAIAFTAQAGLSATTNEMLSWKAIAAK